MAFHEGLELRDGRVELFDDLGGGFDQPDFARAAGVFAFEPRDGFIDGFLLGAEVENLPLGSRCWYSTRLVLEKA
ncbi:hypothetical protein Thiowin_04005 [Thiorhodovibrio winogradskyi]|uniref:Uncharacterized protein n=1 Tax=Thiorhodovibrio winogradskyi TaxID=77007 RepID=A0ABZ0SH09_9GAMM|nr:hypothetical protein [Thiorhodovibrio winogradskyi]